jgi:hypothetical protein
MSAHHGRRLKLSERELLLMGLQRRKRVGQRKLVGRRSRGRRSSKRGCSILAARALVSSVGAWVAGSDGR